MTAKRSPKKRADDAKRFLRMSEKGMNYVEIASKSNVTPPTVGADIKMLRKYGYKGMIDEAQRKIDRYERKNRRKSMAQLMREEKEYQSLFNEVLGVSLG